MENKTECKECQEIIDNCLHVCSGYCRREGCNCDCGEFCGTFDDGSCEHETAEWNEKEVINEALRLVGQNYN